MRRTKRPLAVADPNAQAEPELSKKSRRASKTSFSIKHGDLSGTKSASEDMKKASCTRGSSSTSKAEAKAPQSSEHDHVEDPSEPHSAMPLPEQVSPTRDEADQREEMGAQEPHSDGIPFEKLPPFDYVLLGRPYHDYDRENSDLPESQQRSEEDLAKEMETARAKEQTKKGPPPTVQREDASHKWIMMRKAYLLLAGSLREADYRSPDKFGMYIYNDFEGYGMMEMIENFLRDLHRESAKAKGKRELKECWVQVSALAHFLLSCGAVATFATCDDGERVCDLIQLIGLMFLTMLELLDQEGQFKEDSGYRDLTLVMALWLGVGYYFNPDTFDQTWLIHTIEYAKDKKIDIQKKASGVSGLDRKITELEYALDAAVADQSNTNHGASAAKAATETGKQKTINDRWGFKNAYKRYAKAHGTHGKIGGTKYDITKMSRGERAQHAFDHEDPLKEFSLKDIQSGNLMLR